LPDWRFSACCGRPRKIVGFPGLLGRALGAGICAKLQRLFLVSKTSPNLLILMMFSEIFAPELGRVMYLMRIWRYALSEILPNIELLMQCGSE
jgi:ABC-type microcin C transport system permease subunit YejE